MMTVSPRPVLMKQLALLFLSACLAFSQSAGVGQIWTVVTGTLQSAAVANGNGTALAIQGLSAAQITVNCSVACSGGTTINFEISQDGTNYSAVSGIQQGTTTVSSTVTNQGTTPTVWNLNISGSQLVRARISAYSAGTITVTTTATAAGAPFSGQAVITGTVTDNVTQFGGNNISTGTGAGGTGIPRVTVSNDSAILGTLGSNGAAATTNRMATLPAIARSNLPSAATTGRDIAPNTDVSGQLLTSSLPANLATYSASKTGLATVASATDISVLSGNASNTVIPVYVSLSCIQTTAGIVDVQLFVRTTADSGGTSTGSPAAIPMDQNNSAASSAVLTYTANPTVNDGTARLIDSQKVAMLAAATATSTDIFIWRPSMGQSVVLRGTAQQLALNLNGVTVTGSSCNVVYRWIETTGL